MSNMQGINSYHMQLTKEQIQNKQHRAFIGGMWDELGQLQFDFLIKMGLKPHHTLLDVGCGALRGGLHFLKYLEPEHYFGLDINPSLIEAAYIEAEEHGLSHKRPNLIIDDKFSFFCFETKFDFMLSVSVFSHLPMNIIIRCLENVRRSLAADGVYYATFFLAPHSAHLKPLTHQPGGITTFYDKDPFHYSAEEMQIMASLAQLDVEIIGDWGHLRNQQMAAFRLRQ